MYDALSSNILVGRLYGNDFSDLESAMIALKMGTPGAFDYIYETTKDTVYYCAYFVLHDISMSEDIVQETFIKVYENIDSYTPRSKPKAWITTIAHNLALNQLAKNKREVATEFTDRDLGVYEHNTDDSVVLEQAFKCLTEQERQIVILHVLVGMKHRELAEMLHLPLGTVLCKYTTSLKKLKKAIEQAQNED